MADGEIPRPSESDVTDSQDSKIVTDEMRPDGLVRQKVIDSSSNPHTIPLTTPLGVSFNTDAEYRPATESDATPPFGNEASKSTKLLELLRLPMDETAMSEKFLSSEDIQKIRDEVAKVGEHWTKVADMVASPDFPDALRVSLHSIAKNAGEAGAAEGKPDNLQKYKDKQSDSSESDNDVHDLS